MEQEFRPRARVNDVVVSELGEETLVYDLADHRSFCLNPAATALSQICDGSQTVDQLASRLGVERAVVLYGLGQLSRANLLVEPLPDGPAPSGLTRRQLAKRIGIAGALALPAVAAFASPAFAGFTSTLVPLSCFPGNTTDLSFNGCPCTGNPECQGVCPVTPNGEPRFCLGGPDHGPFCAPGNIFDMSADGCPCTSNNECIGVCPVNPVIPNQGRTCLT